MIVVLVGESASGKSTIANLIQERDPSFSKIITYTTRPMRDGETDGVDYHFVSEEEFDRMERNGEFFESASYRGWRYGSVSADYNDGKDHVVVLTPHGYRRLKRRQQNSSWLHHTRVIGIYLDVDRRSRVIKLLERGDDIDEAYRRSLSDAGQFDGFEDETEYKITNNGYEKSVEEVWNIAATIINVNKRSERVHRETRLMAEERKATERKAE